MASTYSTNLGIELITTGEQANTWGATTNTNLGTLIEQAISGYTTQAITDGADTVITIPSGASGVARNMSIEMTGALTAARNLVVPANRKLYFIYNNTTGGYAVTVKVSGQPGVSVPNGAKTILVCNGTDVVGALSYAASFSTGAFTATGAVSLSPANAAVVISPTGTGTVTVNPATAGTLNNIAIGGTTPLAGAFTTLTVSGATVPANGVYLPSANTLAFSSNTTSRGSVNANGAWNLVAPAAGNVTLTVNAVAGTHSIKIADTNNASYDAGYLGIPQNAQTSAYAPTLQDRGKHISITTGGVTINANPFTYGTTGATTWTAGDTFLVVNNSGSSQTITAGGSVTFRLGGTATTGNRTVAQYGTASCLCLVGGATPTFIISGAGVA
jgi:hypothetical protein